MLPTLKQWVGKWEAWVRNRWPLLNTEAVFRRPSTRFSTAYERHYEL